MENREHCYTLENIEKAFIKITEPSNAEEEEESINIINEWTVQPFSIITALELICSTKNDSLCFLSSSLIKNKISYYWHQIENEQKIEYFSTLTSIIFSLSNIEDNISYNLIHALSTIALFEWPDEFTNFSEIFYQHDDENKLKISLKILSIFLHEIDETDIITELHRNNLHQYIISEFHEQILFIIFNYIKKPELTNYVLTICNFLFKWGEEEILTNFELLTLISTQYLTNELSIDKAAECLYTAFITRDDTIDQFISYTFCMLDIFANGELQSNVSITTNPKVFKFLLEYFIKCTNGYEILIVYHQIIESSESVAKETADIVDSALQNMQKQNYQIEIIRDNLIQVYGHIFSFPPEKIDEDIQSSLLLFWENKLNNILNEMKDENDNIKPYSKFVLPLYIDISFFLFNLLNNFAFYENDDDDSLIKEVFSCNYNINPDCYISFLKSQLPSPQLCYAIGLIESNIDQTKENKILKILLNILQYLSHNNSSEFVSSLLFSMSRWCHRFYMNNQFFDAFIKLIGNSLIDDKNDVSTSGTYALYYVVMHYPSILKTECLNIIEFLIKQSQLYIQNIEQKAVECLFNSCTRLIRYYKKNNSNLKDNIIQTMHINLFEPIVEILNNPDEYDQEMIEKILRIIEKVFFMSNTTALYLYDYVWPPLFEFASKIIVDENFSCQLVECALIAIGRIQQNLKYEQIQDEIEDISNLMLKRGKIEDCYFTYFQIIRSNFDELDPFLENIIQQFMIPYISNENATSIEMFRMLKCFNSEYIDIEWLESIVIETIQNMGTDVSFVAIELIYSCMLYNYNHFIQIDFDIIFELTAIFVESIIDLIHKPLLKIFCHAIFNFKKMIEYLNETDFLVKLKNIITSQLDKSSEEPESGFFDNFVDYLFDQSTESEFENSFYNLLILLRKATPYDINIFKRITEHFCDDDCPINLEEHISLSNVSLK